FRTALHVTMKARNIEIAKRLLDAGANPAAKYGANEHQPLHMATDNNDLEMMKLLLDHGALIDSEFRREGRSETALPYACFIAHLEMAKLLLERSASLECRGHYGPALGFAVHGRNLEMVKLLLNKGADAEVTVPLFGRRPCRTIAK
ncbi:ankyrin repeat protein, partial [Mycena leptocephala]